MQPTWLVTPPQGSRNFAGADYLRQQIAFFEARLLEMGEQGDCAYERALSTAYQHLLQECRQELARLMTVAAA